MNALPEMTSHFVEMLMKESNRVVEASKRLRKLEGLSSHQASALIGISTGYFDNLKPFFREQGYFDHGVNFLEVNDLADWYAKHKTFKNLPIK